MADASLCENWLRGQWQVLWQDFEQTGFLAALSNQQVNVLCR